MRIRVWSEFLSPAELSEPGTLALLNKYGVILGVAFPPDGMNSGYERLLGACADSGVEVSLWPLLAKEDGYWPNERNAARFAAHLMRICDWADSKKVTFSWMAADIELPWQQASALKSSRLSTLSRTLAQMLRDNRDRERFAGASAVFRRLDRDLKDRGIKTIAAAMDFTGFDLMAGGDGFQDLLETPVLDTRWDIVSFMIYTSTIVDLTRGLLPPRAARRHLYSFMSEMKKHMGAQAGVSVGVTSKGVISRVPYKSPAALEPDVRAAKAAGIDDIGVYNLEGILDYAHPEEWFEMILSAEPAIPAGSARTDSYHFIMKLLAKVLS